MMITAFTGGDTGLPGIIPPEAAGKFMLGKGGTGPFKFKEWVSGSHIVLERFDDYWGSKPLVDRIVFKFIFDDDARLIALQRGDVDLAEQITGAGLPSRAKTRIYNCTARCAPSAISNFITTIRTGR